MGGVSEWSSRVERESGKKTFQKSSSPLSLHFAGEKKQHGAVLNGTVIFFFKKIKMNL